MTVFPGQADGPVTLPFQPHSFQARIPAQAQGLGYFIATDELRIKQELTRDSKDLVVGDSVRRTIEIFANQTFAMFLPPVEFQEIEGLAVYPDPPRIQNRSADRIGFQGGERIESATYVIQEEGEYELAPFEIYWWDLSSNRMRTASVNAVEFSAAPNPGYVPEIPLPEKEEVELTAVEEVNWLEVIMRWAALFFLIALFAFSVSRYLGRMIVRIRRIAVERQQRYQESEAAAFDKLKRAARKRDTGGMIRYLYQWLDRIMPGEKMSNLQNLLPEGDHELNEQVTEFFADLYSDKPTDGKWSESVLIRGLAAARGNIRRKGRARYESEDRLLPSLNP
jgi:hypothetical protein